MQETSEAVEKSGVSGETPEPNEGSRPTKEPSEDEVIKLKRLLKEETEKANDYLNRLKYAVADLDNYRKRVEREKQEMKDHASRDMVARLIEVIDEFDLAHAQSENSPDQDLKSGIEMIYRKLREILRSEGLTQIESLGKPFDPHLHEAVEKVKGDPEKNGTVVEEIRKGFLFKGTVLRPSMVRVAYSEKSADINLGDIAS